MGEEKQFKRMMQSYELPQAPSGISQGVAQRIKRRRFWRSLGFRLAAMSSAGLLFTACWALSVWKPAQSLAGATFSACEAFLPTNFTGILWYSSIWVTVSLIIFGVTLLVAGGLRTLEE